LAFAAGLMVLQMIISVGFLPLVLPFLLPNVSVNPAKLAGSLLLLMLLPLAAAMMFRARFAAESAWTKKILDRVSGLSLLVMLVLITAANFADVLNIFGTRGVFASLLFIAAGFGIGWLLGGPSAESKRVLALGTASRNFAAAMVVASQSFTDPRVVVMIVLVAIASLLLLMPLSWLLAKG
jgi:BASS family bile acid:Na+ symporter